jgi:hypothetical protein
MVNPKKQKQIWKVQDRCDLSSRLDEPGLEDFKEREKGKKDYTIPPYSSKNRYSPKYKNKD